MVFHRGIDATLVPSAHDSTDICLNELEDDQVDALLMFSHVTAERLSHFDYASELPFIRLVALYQSHTTGIVFDALTANIGWRAYVLFLLCIASFGVLHRVAEKFLLPRTRVSFASRRVKERHFAARERVAYRTRVHAAAEHAEHRAQKRYDQKSTLSHADYYCVCRDNALPSGATACAHGTALHMLFVLSRALFDMSFIGAQASNHRWQDC